MTGNVFFFQGFERTYRNTGWDTTGMKLVKRLQRILGWKTICETCHYRSVRTFVQFACEEQRVTPEAFGHGVFCG